MGHKERLIICELLNYKNGVNILPDMHKAISGVDDLLSSDETPHAAVWGRSGNRFTLLVATNARVINVIKGAFTNTFDFKNDTYGSIKSVDHTLGLFCGNVTIHYKTKGKLSVETGSKDRQQVLSFVEFVSDHIGRENSPRHLLGAQSIAD